MSNAKMDPLIQQMENYLECWKQFNQSVNLARSKKFSAEDENQTSTFHVSPGIRLTPGGRAATR